MVHYVIYDQDKNITMALQKTVKPIEQLELLKIFKILALYIYSQIIFSPKNFCSKP